MSRVLVPFRLASASGVSIQLNANGSIRRIDCGDIVVNLFLGNELEGGPANLYLRRHGKQIEWTPLLGPCSPSRLYFEEDLFAAEGQWQCISYRLELCLAASVPAWFWHVWLRNDASSVAEVDLVYAQDLALAHYAAARLNEYYVSQYVDHTPLEHPRHGFTVASRQNMAMDGRHPWSLIGSTSRAVGFATDALQMHGLATRAGQRAAGLQSAFLPNARRQHEHSMAVLQQEPISLSPGEEGRCGFFVCLEANHESPTSQADLERVDKALALPEARRWVGNRSGEGLLPVATLFSNAPLLPCLDLSTAEVEMLFGPEHREVEMEGGRLLSFWTGADRHVVLRAKEVSVLRPHGQILRSGRKLVPEEESLTSTVWMAGVFHSLLTQGHVHLNRFLSATRSYLGLFRSLGQRIFVEIGGMFHLLDVPSAFEMAPSACRWVYKHAGGLLEVRCWAGLERHQMGLSIEVHAGAPCRFLLSHHLALNGDDGAEASSPRIEASASAVCVRPSLESEMGRRFPQGGFRIEVLGGGRIERCGGDEILFADGRSRQQPFVVLVSEPVTALALRITGELFCGSPVQGSREPAGVEDFWTRMSGRLRLRAPAGTVHAAGVAQLQEILPWYAHDALIHYLAPRGLEQYSGGGWGTRDVCQGPVELLLALAEWAPLRDLLLRVFRQQNRDGDWPQWFMFFECARHLRAAESHGDIVFWPLLALARYVLSAEDPSIFDEVVPFFEPAGVRRPEHGSIEVHVERALALVERRVIAGTRLAAYGRGDWDDSLQPADPSMAEQMCSSWTVTLCYQTLRALAAALRMCGRDGRAQRLETAAAAVREDFHRWLIPDGVVAGFAYFRRDGRIDYLLHPRDPETGIRYRLLPMVHGILSELFTAEEAAAHSDYIRRFLLGPDGARLFDRPLPYRGGLQRHFQRAESSSFFGREIGLMYTHAHLRYAEAMACLGEADAFFLALRQAIPVGIDEVVTGARRRQGNCYYSSSDAEFADRYDAAARYEELRAGRIPFQGGWRVYSSGAGIAYRLIQECFLGIRRGKSMLTIDPVIPPSLDGVRAKIELQGRTIEVVYRVGVPGSGPVRLELNGMPLDFERLSNPYRTGGVRVSMRTLDEGLCAGANTLTVYLGSPS